MYRITLKLSELNPNPYKKFIQDGALNEEVVKQVMESAERTSLWEQWVVRETLAGYQLAFGHNRLEAAKRLLGADAKVSVQVEAYTDPQMFTAMADENAGEAESTAQQVDVIRKAKQLLESNPSWCKTLQYLSHSGTHINKGADKRHDHGSVNCILDFLGEANWSHTKIAKLLQLADKAAPAVINAIGGLEGSRHLKPKEIGQGVAVKLSELDESSQTVFIEEVKKQDRVISGDLLLEAIDEIRDKPSPKKIKTAINRKAEAQKTKERKQQAKSQTKGKPKAKKPLPDMKGIMQGWVFHFQIVAEEMKDVLLPNLEALELPQLKPTLDELTEAIKALGEVIHQCNVKVHSEPKKLAGAVV